VTLRPAPANGQPWEVKLDVFEGPFQLLLSLITERRVDVCDVPIARLCEDYLAHLEAMEKMDLEVATEFLVVAATLLQLKARRLLPSAEEAEQTEEDVERDLLIVRLLEVRTFQAAGEHLSELLRQGDRYHPPAPASDDESLRRLPVLGDISAADLGRTLVGIVLESLRGVDVSLLVGGEVTSQDAVAAVIDGLRDGATRFADLVRGRNMSWSVAIFCAMLELVMRGELALEGGLRLGDIRIELTGEGDLDR
jgi:segregation and condensation protein A